jgi:hypothetical protein
MPSLRRKKVSMPPLGAAAIAAIVTSAVGAAASIGTGILGAVKGGGGGGDQGPQANPLNAQQRTAAAALENKFSFGRAGDSLNPNAQLGKNLLSPPNSMVGNAQHLSGGFNTNRFGLGGQ